MTTHSRMRPLDHAASDSSGTAPAVRLLARYLDEAVRQRASDLHFEPSSDGLHVRIRVDGVLRSLERPPAALVAQLLTRIRLLARVDLAERRLPQDGRFTIETGTEGPVDVRAAFLPVAHGEKLALRLLRRHAQVLALDMLGLGPAQVQRLQSTLARPDGLIVVVGPTGSGKTTTLYAALAALTSDERSLVSVEDPVEMELDGVAQVPVDDESGRGFAVVLRAILRQDPDVLMVGEVRDTESARIACRAALTGHLVLTSLHAADTREALVRLRDMDVPPYLVDATVSLVIAQRLLRRLCPRCRRARVPLAEEARLFARHEVAPPRALAEPVGCDECDHAGYRGRLAVFELRTGARAQHATHEPITGLFAAGLARAAAQETSLAEVLARCPESLELSRSATPRVATRAVAAVTRPAAVAESRSPVVCAPVEER